jgi:DNA-3-methyladenine glycosylase
VIPPGAGSPPRLPAWTAHAHERSDIPDLAQDVPIVARELLGCRLISTIGGEAVEGLIVETEAYLGPDDPASHAATRSGITARNQVMFGPAGRAYVYRSYGVHWCLNVVAGSEGEGGAVLLRGLDLIRGEAAAARRRGDRRPLTRGPGRLAAALGVTDALYDHDLSREPLRLAPGWSVDEYHVAVTPRIGISKARERLLRYHVRDSSGVSR